MILTSMVLSTALNSCTSSMNDFSHDWEYTRLLEDILANGEDAMDRTGTGTRSVFGRQMRFDLRKAFPALTTKKLAWNAVISELVWFLEGSGSNPRLATITHGDKDKKTIWTPNAEAGYWTPKAKYPGDLGRVYGVQWRKWKKTTIKDEGSYVVEHLAGGETLLDAKVLIQEIDQVANIINEIKTNPKSRRMVLTAYNVGELDQMALPPCHMFAQFHVNSRDELSCQVYIRSNDMFLGAPFNIASYAALVHMMAHVTDKGVGDLIITIGDAHIYSDHMDQVKEQIARQPFASPQLKIKRQVESIDDFKKEDFELVGYQSHESIKAKMAV